MALTSIHPLRGKLNKPTPSEAHIAWRKKHIRTYRVRFIIDGMVYDYRFGIHKEKAKDMIKWLEAHRPIQTTIKRLILAEMEREKRGQGELPKSQNKPL